ncbi:hypothetical protein Hanom_Chr13g01206521 [Helianthus anomalus]
MQIGRRVVAVECFPYLTRWLALAVGFHVMPLLPSHNQCLLQRWLPLLLTHHQINRGRCRVRICIPWWTS